MIPRTFSLALAGVFLAAAFASAADDKLSADDIAKAEKAVKEQLEKGKASAARVQRIDDAVLAKVFPKHAFFSAIFPQYPVARLAPEPYKSANIFAVGADMKPTLITDSKALSELFIPNVEAADDDKAKDAARAWVALASTFHQDGFYKFKVADDAKVAKEGNGKKVSAQVTVMQGGNGEINAELIFDDKGKITKVNESSKLRPGPRPICQATKLLDADPIVRRMAEQDLLIMGRAARGYLTEQRAKATPELQRAIDRMWQRIVEQDQ
jgi:hypothetical protein